MSANPPTPHASRTKRSYTKRTVLEAARARIRWLHTEFPRIIVNTSGGKDSTVVLHLTLEAAEELALLRRSIEADGITQPIVVTPDPNTPGDYIIVDGYHRFWTITNTPSIRAATNGQAPCVILDKPLTDRMASTVRHNRARGRHQLTGMASMIYAMLDAGMPDHDICNELGMEPEELHRLKHVTGFSKLMQDRAYNQEWLTKNQIKARKAYRDAMTEEANASGDEHP